MQEIKIFSFFVLLVLTHFSISSAFKNRNRVTIGAFFDQENSDIELAFKYAIQWHNIYENEGTIFDPFMRVAPESNIFHTRGLVCNTTSIDSGVIALFGPKDPIAHLVTQQVCKDHHIPYIQTTWQPPTYDPPLISLNFFPAADLLAEGFAEILHHMKWDNYAIVYQDDEALIRLQGIFEMLEVNEKSVPVRQLKAGGDNRSMFKKLKISGITNIILDCKTHQTIDILRQADEVGLLTHSSTYLLTDLDAHTTDFKPLNTTANIFLVRLFDPSDRYLDYTIQMWSFFENKNDRHISISARTIRTEVVLMVDAIDLLLKAVNDFNKKKKIQGKPMFCDFANTWADGREFANYLKKYHLSSPITGPIAFDKYGRRVNFTLQVVKLDSITVDFTWSPKEDAI